MRLKRTSLVLSTLVLALVLAACANNPTEPATASPPAGETAASPESILEVPEVGTSPEAATSPDDQVAQASPAAEASPAPTGGATGDEAPVEQASAGEFLQTVRDRGQLICGVNQSLPGFGSLDAEGNFVGFDVDFCRAVAAAIFNDPDAVQFRPLTTQNRFTAVQTREVDMLIRNTTLTLSRDTSVGLDFGPVTFYDGQGMMVRQADGITSLEDMDGASICVQSGTTTELNLADNFRARDLNFTPVVFEEADPTYAAYDQGQCDGVTSDKSQLASRRLGLQNPDEHVILDVTMSKEPLAPAVLQGDPQWADILTWVVYGTMEAEEYGVSSENIDEMLNSDDPNIRRLLGAEGDLGAMLGLENDFMVNVIQQVGNYGEIYERNLGAGSDLNLPRGQNALYTEGGLLYAAPFR